MNKVILMGRLTRDPDPGCDQIIDIINYIVIPHKVLPLQDLRVLVLQKGIGLDGPVPSLCVLWV